MATDATTTNTRGRMSLELASRLFDWSSIALAIGACIVFVATAAIVWLGIVKEHHWEVLRERANERIAGLNNETAKLTADNLALQTVLLPRSVGSIGINQEPPAKKWFAGFERWSGTKVLIQVIPGDPEAQNLANEIALVLSRFGWVPAFISETRSGVSLNLSEGLSVFSPASYKAWDPQNEAQQVFRTLGDAARSLATALTNAGLGVGPYPVSGTRGLMMVVDFPSDSQAGISDPFRNFSPKLDGIYLQVGSRPVSATVAWIKQGRPDELGNKPADAGVAAPHK